MELPSDQKEFKVGDIVRHDIRGIVRIIGIPLEGVLNIISPDVNKTRLGNLSFNVLEHHVSRLSSLEKELL